MVIYDQMGFTNEEENFTTTLSGIELFLFKLIYS